LWDLEEDRRCDLIEAGLRARGHRLAASVDPSAVGDEQARSAAPVDEPQAQAPVSLPLAWGERGAAKTPAGCFGRDRGPDPVLRADQRTGVMGADHDRSLRPDQRRGVQALAGLRVGLIPDRVGELPAWPCAGDLADPGGSRSSSRPNALEKAKLYSMSSKSSGSLTGPLFRNLPISSIWRPGETVPYDRKVVITSSWPRFCDHALKCSGVRQ